MIALTAGVGGVAGIANSSAFPCAASELEIRFSPPDAAAIDPEEAEDVVVIELTSGSRLRGVVLDEDEEWLTLRTEELGDLVIPLELIVRRLDAAAPLGPADPAPKEPPPGVFGTAFLRGWDKNISLGFAGKQGNIDEGNLNIQFAGDYEDDRRRWRVRAGYFYGVTEGTRSKDEGSANARRDFLLPDNPWFAWGEGRAQYDDFQPWEWRLGAFAGIGYEFVNRERLRVLGRLGAGGSYEFGEVDEFNPEALIAAELRWSPWENHTINLANTLFPSLDDTGEFRNVTEASWTATMDRGRGLSLKIGIENEYESHPAGDVERNDLRYFGAVVLEF